jgi:hypothetical protein
MNRRLHIFMHFPHSPTQIRHTGLTRINVDGETEVRYDVVLVHGEVVSQALVTALKTTGEYGHLEWKSRVITLGFSIYECRLWN